MNENENLPAEVKYWLSPDTKHDCYFIVGSESGPTERIGAFKAFLIGYSEPLRAMLQDSELAEQGDISIIDIEPDTFKVFLKCLYMALTDAIISNLTFEKCCNLLYVADKYLVTRFKETLIKQCLSTLSPEISCINVARSSKAFMQEACLKTALSNLVGSNVKLIISSEKFLEITKNSLLWILKLDPLDIDEITLWQAVLKWAKNNTNSNDGSVLRQCALKLLKCIRFCTMDVKDFRNEVVPTNVLRNKEIIQICKYYGTNEIPNMKYVCNIVTCRGHTDDYKQEPKPKDISYCYCVSDVQRFSGRKISGTFEFLNFNWCLITTRVDNYLGVYLECEGPKTYDPNWKCCVKATATLLKYGVVRHMSKFSYFTYCRECPRLGWSKFILWSDVMDPLKFYISNNSIKILVTVYA